MRLVYSETLMDHFERPRQVGQLDAEAAYVGTGTAGTRETGGVLRMQILVDAGRITDCRFKAYGPPALIAAGSWLAEAACGASLPRAHELTHGPIAQALALPPAYLHCALLAEDAIRAAIQDYTDKLKVYA